MAQVILNQPRVRAFVRQREPATMPEHVRMNLNTQSSTLANLRADIERKIEKEDQKKKFHRIERCFGTFRRSFTLPEDADSTKVTADFHDGVLKVHLPTTPIARSKAIDVKVK
jgi:HSP20 family protein